MDHVSVKRALPMQQDKEFGGAHQEAIGLEDHLTEIYPHRGEISSPATGMARAWIAGRWRCNRIEAARSTADRWQATCTLFSANYSSDLAGASGVQLADRAGFARLHGPIYLGSWDVAPQLERKG
jgi:hypothetical protein